MKKLLIAALLFCGTGAHATLKLQAQANGFDNGRSTRPMLGMALYQPFLKKFALNAWAGTGIEPFELRDDVVWSGAKAQIDFYVKDLTFAPGYMYKDIDGSGNDRSYAYLRIEYKLF